MNRTFLTLLSLLLAPTLLAQSSPADEAVPENLLGFLKPGMSIGIHSIDGTSDVRVTVYSSGELRIAQDSQILDLEELAERYGSVRMEAADLATANHAVRLVPGRRITFAEIEAIGNDYVLVKLLGDGGDHPVVWQSRNTASTKSRRQVLSKTSISRIDLDGAGARFMLVPAVALPDRN